MLDTAGQTTGKTGTQSHPSKKKKKKEMTKNMVQTKEQCRNLQDKINEEETGNLPEKEFRV